ncbi:glyoxalase [Amycolatopsis sp. FBCC-B4732]|uniref:VOC family protein n=1 Tax=Amycolatopsis sp. FBCC-B4732 TaxID=3079339 RepID=UPI001FF27772|nr:VOC family protein [Amycolatopsis sp. FBCC-B4732]UOX91618.1 glyoxalase [Amycolatopsis sp. FBCC-B4732]
MTITHVQFLTLPVADHARARDFYVGKLGFEAFVDRRTPEGGRFVLVAPKGAKTGVVLTDQQVTDLDTDVAALRAAGVEVAEPEERPWGRATSFKDLDGRTLGLLQPSDFGTVPN